LKEVEVEVPPRLSAEIVVVPVPILPENAKVVCVGDPASALEIDSEPDPSERELPLEILKEGGEARATVPKSEASAVARKNLRIF
jgi:hypothetical protein